jgi:cleavage stimulation factor subunit 3
MTDSNAELAFLQSLQSGTTASYANGDEHPAHPEQEDEDYDPTSLMPNTAYDPADVSTRSSLSGSMPQSPSTPSGDKSSAKAATHPLAASIEVSSAPAKQPRTVGGFVVDDDDDEDDDDDDEEKDQNQVSLPKASGSHGLMNVAQGSSSTPQRSMSETPNNAVSTPDVPIHKPEGVHTTGVPEAVSNLSHFPAHSGASAQDVAVKSPSVASQTFTKSVASPVGAQSKARLPNDRVGMFEDRIAEDPRGDMDAWLGLISEHRKRNKLEEARDVYERFFSVFPTAVSYSCQW